MPNVNLRGGQIYLFNWHLVLGVGAGAVDLLLKPANITASRLARASDSAGRYSKRAGLFKRINSLNLPKEF